jgi:hypothetical protein
MSLLALRECPLSGLERNSLRRAFKRDWSAPYCSTLFSVCLPQSLRSNVHISPFNFGCSVLRMS